MRLPRSGACTSHLASLRARAGVIAFLAISLASQTPSLAAQDTSTRGITIGRGPDSASLAASRYHALLIGVQDYSDPGMGRLQAPVRDAERLRDVLTRRYRFNPSDVTVLRNPTREGILGELTRLSDALGPNDNLLIFYAGHGHWDQGSHQSYWLPKDARPANTALWVSNSDVEGTLRRMKARHVLVIADACYAGALLLREVQPDPAMSRLYELPSRKAMTSGSKETVPDESRFLDYLIQRLDANRARYLPADELFSSFRTAVMNNSPVQPQFGTIANVGDEGGEFLFPLRQARSAADSLVAEFGDTASNPVVGGDTSRGTLPTTPREIIQLRIREFVDRIAKKDLPSLDEAYRAVPGQPADWKENLLRLIRDDLISASVAGTPEILIEGTEATVDLKVLTQYNDPVVAGKPRKVLHFQVHFRQYGSDWSPRSYSLVEKPPF